MSKFGEKFVSGLAGSLSGVAGGFVGSAGSKLIDGLFGSDPNKKNKELMQMQNQFNAQEAQKNRDFQVDMFNRTNEYNSPKAQMQRFMEAGLNPDLMYGNGASSIAAQSPSGSQASGTSPIAAVDMQQRAANVALTQAQTRLLEHQADNLDSGTNLNNANTQTQLTYNEFQRQLLQGQIEFQNVQIKLGQFDLESLKPAELARLYAEVKNIQQNTVNLEATLSKIKAEVSNINADTYSKLVSTFLNSQKTQAEIREIASRCNLNEAQVRYMSASLLLQARGLDIQQQNADTQAKLVGSQVELNKVQQGFVTTQNNRLLFDFEIDQGRHTSSPRALERRAQQSGHLTKELFGLATAFQGAWKELGNL